MVSPPAPVSNSGVCNNRFLPSQFFYLLCSKVQFGSLVSAGLGCLERWDVRLDGCAGGGVDLTGDRIITVANNCNKQNKAVE